MPLPKSKKELLKKFVNYKCELCKKKFKSEELQIHRIKRGEKGGKYTLNNIKVLCKTCHKKIHSGEF